MQQFEGVLNEPKVLSVQYLETNTKQEDGLVRIAITPSNLIKDNKSVLFNCNHHFENPKGTDTKQIIALLNEKWDYSIQKIIDLNNSIWDKAKF